MTDLEREDAITAKLEENKVKNEEISRELNTLKARKDSIGADRAEATEIDKKIEELEDLLKKKYGLTYGYGVSRVMLEEWEPVLLSFIEKHALPENTVRVISTMLLRNVPLSAEKISEIAKDENVVSIEIPEVDNADIFVNTDA